MNKICFHSIFLGFISLFFLCSCDALEVTREITFDLEYPVKSSGQAFSTEMILDPYEESEDFETVEDKMESAEIIRIEYTVTYFNGPDEQKLEQAEWLISDSLGTDPQVLCSITNANLQSMTSEIRELPMNPAGTKRFDDMVENSNYKSIITFRGQSNSAPVDFRLKLFITMKVTGYVI